MIARAVVHWPSDGWIAGWVASRFGRQWARWRETSRADDIAAQARADSLQALRAWARQHQVVAAGTDPHTGGTQMRCACGAVAHHYQSEYEEVIGL